MLTRRISQKGEGGGSKLNRMEIMEVPAPDCFSFKECLAFLGRSDQEVLHRIEKDSFYKLMKVNGELLLLKISCKEPQNPGAEQKLQIQFLVGKPSEAIAREVTLYLEQLFDWQRDLQPFYERAEQDEILQPLVKRYYGMRIVGIPDLFEALTWAIIGQQITLSFAYTMKKRFVEQFGEKVVFEKETYWLYPTVQTVAALEVDDLRQLQFTTRKAEYVIEVAKKMATGELKKEGLLQMQEPGEMHKALTAIRGVGAWTADYVMMKSLQQATAFPIADVGLHNALKVQLGWQEKPSQEQIRQMAQNWKGWEAYATFYLWRSLYDDFT